MRAEALLRAHVAFLARFTPLRGSGRSFAESLPRQSPTALLFRELLHRHAEGLGALNAANASSWLSSLAEELFAAVESPPTLPDPAVIFSGRGDGERCDVDFVEEAALLRSATRQQLGSGDIDADLGESLSAHGSGRSAAERVIVGSAALASPWMPAAAADLPSVVALAELFRKIHACPVPERPVVLGTAEARAVLRGMGPPMSRKHLEVERLVHLVRDLRLRLSCCNVFDVGAGKGHLGEALNALFRIPCCSIDRDWRKHEFASSVYGSGGGDGVGHVEARRTRRQVNVIDTSARAGNSCVHQHSFREVSAAALGPLVRSVGLKRALVVGLHTCGSLADTAATLATQSEAAVFVNVPCCLPKLVGASDGHAYRYAPRSQLGAELHLDSLLGEDALHLANLSHERTQEEFNLWVHLRAREFALRLFLGTHKATAAASPIAMPRAAMLAAVSTSLDKRSRGGFEGHASKRECQHHLAHSPFAEFCRVWDRATGSRALTLCSDDALGAFWDSAQCRQAVTSSIVDKVLADQLGLSCEVAVLLDRAFGVAECGYAVLPVALLPRTASTRHMGIVAVRHRVVDDARLLR